MQNFFGSGRLAVSTNDFKNHTNGSTLKHESSTITISPTVILDGYEADNVKAALVRLGEITNNLSNEATTTVLGLIQMTGDLDNVGSSPKVKRVTGDSGSILESDARTVSFTHTTSGTNVIGFKSSSTSPSDLEIRSQTSSVNLFSSANGGALALKTGARNTLSGSSRNGSYAVYLGSTDVVLSANNLASSVNVLGLFKNVTTTEVPSPINNAVYVADASADQSSSPVNGSVLYSRSGKIKVKYGNGDNFILGDHPDEWISGEASYRKVYNRVANVGTSSMGPVEVFAIAATAEPWMAFVESTIIGAGVGGMATYKIYGAYYFDGGGGGITQIDPINIVEQRNLGTTAVDWNPPSFGPSGTGLTTLTLYSGDHTSGSVIDWVAYTTCVVYSAL